MKKSFSKKLTCRSRIEVMILHTIAFKLIINITLYVHIVNNLKNVKIIEKHHKKCRSLNFF